MQVVKYKWQNFKPLFVAKDGAETKKIGLLGNDIRFRVGKKTCMGYTKDGKSRPCRSSRETEGTMCDECRLEDDYYFCIRCDGLSCINQKKREECSANHYYIYLAAFGPLLKVGISHEFRVMERLVEQGADFGAKIARVRDGKTVRAMEQQIKKEINIADRVTGDQKQTALFCDPNISVKSIFHAISLLRGNGFGKHITSPEIYDLRVHYRLENVLAQPEQIEITEGVEINGSAVSAKGNVVIINNRGSFFSFNAHRLLGREIIMAK